MNSQLKLKILVADDDLINRMILERMLLDVGHEVIMAEDGFQAVDQFIVHEPDLILMDVMMPDMDGYEATEQIKIAAEDRGFFVPVIFLTAITDEEGLAQCISAGGDDFLTKPFTKIILLAKIKAMQRLSDLYKTINQRKQELILEQETAKVVFNRLIELGSLRKHTNFKYLNSSMSLFNGDLLIAADSPDGSVHLLLGDATGHGLPAALVTVPVFDTFYAMCEKGMAPEMIITTLNNKLKERLPVQYFICAAMIHIAPDGRQVKIWNCGLPEVVIYSAASKTIRNTVKATALPLGIRGKIDLIPQELTLAVGDRIYAYSDGVTEAQNPAGEMYGRERLEACFHLNDNPDTLFDEILMSVRSFTRGLAQNDDLTMVEVKMIE